MENKDKIKIDRALKLIAKLSIDKSSQVLSKMIKSGASIELEDVYMADISRVTEEVMLKADNEVVGAFIDLVGDAPFKFLFYVNTKDSLVLTDLMLRREIGLTKEFNLYAQSAVQELGNILASAISNIFSTDFQISMKPKPPTVINDFESIVFQEYVIDAACERNEILIIQSIFRIVKFDIHCSMFIMPLGKSEQILQYVTGFM
ncbi:MAG: hypothetical protein DRP78_05770 [Candidatus Omnitrophota bacterium]|nr:MAG: hypothetical protein DRP78_05770 [Candidatus Omnitrophota bacterium]